MIEKSKWPESLKDANPHNFSITKQDLLDQTESPVSPEQYVNLIIKDWMESVTTELERSAKPHAWDQYPSFFGREVVYANEHFPRTIPVGYVLVCFFRSVYPRVVKVAELKRIINYWMYSRNNRSEMFNAQVKGKWFVTQDEINYCDVPADFEPAPEPDGKDKADILYGGRQGTMFGGT